MSKPLSIRISLAEAAEVETIRAALVAQGLAAALEEPFVNTMGPMLPLDVLLNARGLDPEAFFDAALADPPDAAGSCAASPSLLDTPTGKGLHVLGLLPCPLRQPLVSAFETYLAENPCATPLKYCLEGNANQQLSYYGLVPHFERLEDLPDLMISPGINAFFGSAFRERFLDRGCFADASEDAAWTDEAYQPLRDPLRQFTVLCWNVLVMVVDHTQWSGTTLPQCWGDLLAPDYRNRVAIRGQKEFFCETVLLNFYRDFGMDGIRQFAESVLEGVHPAEMVKWAGVGRAGKPAVMIMPYFFARLIKRKDRVTIVWPRDGAIASPVSMLVKRDSGEELQKIARFLAGPDVARLCAKAFFPSHHPAARAELPEPAPLKWLGWDFIRHEDMDACLEEVMAQFLPIYRDSRPGGRP
jgi:ABC-type Fe3+ transport system substrate-binding protein